MFLEENVIALAFSEGCCFLQRSNGIGIISTTIFARFKTGQAAPAKQDVNKEAPVLPNLT
jgi:hypothetical protein